MIRLLFCWLLAGSSTVLACPRIGGLVDFNCDGVHKVAALGDSLVKGRGDLRFDNNGGYVKRIERAWERSTVARLGLPGFSSLRILEKVKIKLHQKSTNKFKTGLLDTDIVIIDAGRNDFFEFETPEPNDTIVMLGKLVSYLKRRLSKGRRAPPLFVVTTLAPTTRGFQRSFVDNVNILLKESSSDLLPVRLYFDQLDPALISSDGIHPTSDGYSALAEIALAYLGDGAQTESRAQRPDNDDDGIYDMFEQSKFSCNPEKRDTDDDGLNDGPEEFTHLTDPTVPDTDGDGVLDGSEITAGTNPLDPLSL